MAFWGAPVQPDEPLNVIVQNQRGPYCRLRISQAALGGRRSKAGFCKKYHYSKCKSRLFCKVGETPRVLVCCLSFKAIEMCSLDLQFKAPDNVVFSVCGTRDIHISGYYFNEFPLRPPNNQIAAASDGTEVVTSRDTLVLKSPQKDDPQIGGLNVLLHQVLDHALGPATSTMGLKLNKDIGCLKAPNSADNEAEQSKNLVHVNGSPSVDKCRKSVAEDSGELLTGNGDSHPPVVSADGHNDIQNQETDAEVAEKSVEIDDQTIEALVNRIAAEAEMQQDARAVACNDNQMAVCVGHIDKAWRCAEESALHDGADQRKILVEENGSPSIKKCLGIEAQAPQQPQMNITALGQGQPIFAYGWREIQSLPQLLMHIGYCLLTKVPCMRNWTNLVISFGRRGSVQEALQVCHPMNGHAEHGVLLARLGGKYTSDDSANPFGNFVGENSCPRIRETSPSADERKLHGNLVVENNCPSSRDDSQLADEERLNLEKKKKKRRIDRNSTYVDLTINKKEASVANQPIDDTEPINVDCSKSESSIKRVRSAKWIFKRRGIEEENRQSVTDDLETSVAIHHSGEQEQLNSKEKRSLETMCSQDLCNKTSQLDDRDSMHHKKGKKNKIDQVLASGTKREHGRFDSLKPAALQLTSAGIGNSNWTIVAGLPAFGNPKINIVDLEETCERPSVVHDSGDMKKKKKLKGKKEN